MKFLVVDDLAAMRRAIIRVLGKMGFDDCIEAENGAKALEIFDSSVGFVITNWNMPKMNGLDLTRALRGGTGGEQGKRVPVLMITTRSLREDIIQAAEVDVDDYIVKPFTPHELEERITWTLRAVQRRS